MTKRKATKDDKLTWGSDKHAAMLGLRKAEEGDTRAYQGWTLVDVTQFGTNPSSEYLSAVLRQKVSVLLTPPEMPQDTDPGAPNYRQPMWQPPTISEMTDAYRAHALAAAGSP